MECSRTAGPCSTSQSPSATQRGLRNLLVAGACLVAFGSRTATAAVSAHRRALGVQSPQRSAAGEALPWGSLPLVVACLLAVAVMAGVAWVVCCGDVDAKAPRPKPNLSAIPRKPSLKLAAAPAVDSKEPSNKKGVAFSSPSGHIELPPVPHASAAPHASFRRSMAASSVFRNGPSRPDTAGTSYSGTSGMLSDLEDLSAGDDVEGSKMVVRTTTTYSTTSGVTATTAMGSKSKWWKSNKDTGTWSKKVLRALNMMPGEEVPPTPIQYTRPRPPRHMRFIGVTWWMRLRSWHTARIMDTRSVHSVERTMTARTQDEDLDEHDWQGGDPSSRSAFDPSSRYFYGTSHRPAFDPSSHRGAHGEHSIHRAGHEHSSHHKPAFDPSAHRAAFEPSHRSKDTSQQQRKLVGFDPSTHSIFGEGATEILRVEYTSLTAVQEEFPRHHRHAAPPPEPSGKGGNTHRPDCDCPVCAERKHGAAPHRVVEFNHHNPQTHMRIVSIIGEEIGDDELEARLQRQAAVIEKQKKQQQQMESLPSFIRNDGYDLPGSTHGGGNYLSIERGYRSNW